MSSTNPASDEVIAVTDKTPDIIDMRERLKIFGQLTLNTLNADEGVDDEDEDDEDDDEYDEPEEIRHVATYTQANRTKTRLAVSKNDQSKSAGQQDYDNEEEDEEDEDFLNEGALNQVLSSFNPTKLKPLEPIDICITKFTDKIDLNKNSSNSAIAELNERLSREEHQRRRLEFELNELKNKIEKEYKPKLESYKAENIKLNKLYQESQRELKDWQNKGGIHSSHIEQLEKLKIENYRLAEYKTRLEEKEKELKSYQDLMKTVKINNNWYQLISVIGKGGFSEVYQCLSFKEGKNYALKKVKLADLDAENLKLIMNEIELLKKLKSTEKCIQIFDHELDKAKNLLYVVMELGSTDLSRCFKAEIQKYQCVREPDRVYYWKKMLEAVQAIHKADIIHNDIKPSNFVVVGCEVKLIDFNISNSMNERTSITLNFDCGTLSYMSPESIRNDNRKINQKVDVWSLGVILYLMTYGKLPFQHLKRQQQVMFAICDQSRAELKIAPIENEHLYDSINRCLMFNPADRYTIEELLSHPYIISRN